MRHDRRTVQELLDLLATEEVEGLKKELAELKSVIREVRARHDSIDKARHGTGGIWVLIDHDLYDRLWV